MNHPFCNRFLVHRSWVGPLACTLSKLRLWLWHVVRSSGEGMAVGKKGNPGTPNSAFSKQHHTNQWKPIEPPQHPIVIICFHIRSQWLGFIVQYRTPFLSNGQAGVVTADLAWALLQHAKERGLWRRNFNCIAIWWLWLFHTISIYIIKFG